MKSAEGYARAMPVGAEAGRRSSERSMTFGPFHLNVQAPCLIRDGVGVRLRAQALAVLRALVSNSGRCLSYEELLCKAWGGRWVSRHTVAVTVNEVQKALQDCGGWIRYYPKLGYQFEIPYCEDLIRTGWHHWLRHTREGFEKAILCFRTVLDSGGPEARACEGISRSCLMLGIFGMRHPAEMHTEFTKWHDRAVAAGGMTPELTCDLAQSLQFFERRFADAENQLITAVQNDPRSAGAYIRLAVLYACLGRFGEALDFLEDARERDPLWPILPACESMIHCCRGDMKQALLAGRNAVDLHPFLSIGRSYYAQALERSGNAAEALIEYRTANSLSPDLPRLRAEEAHCLARMGRHAEARIILDQLLERARAEFIDSSAFAPVYAALGNTEEALNLLERSLEDGSPHLALIDVDYRLDSLRRLPRFNKLRKRIFRETGSRFRKTNRFGAAQVQPFPRRNN